jgi:hypothetical protein
MESCRKIVGKTPLTMTPEAFSLFIYEELGRQSKRIIEFTPVKKEKVKQVVRTKKSLEEERLMAKILADSAAYLMRKERGEDV